jgi:hypothetical protein
VRQNVVGNDAASVGLGQFEELGFARGFFLEDCAELGFCDDLLEDGIFGAGEVVPLLILRYPGGVERPDADFSNLERVEHVHGDSVGTLVRQMASDSAAQSVVPFRGGTQL